MRPIGGGGPLGTNPDPNSDPGPDPDPDPDPNPDPDPGPDPGPGGPLGAFAKFVPQVLPSRAEGSLLALHTEEPSSSVAAACEPCEEDACEEEACEEDACEEEAREEEAREGSDQDMVGQRALASLPARWLHKDSTFGAVTVEPASITFHRLLSRFIAFQPPPSFHRLPSPSIAFHRLPSIYR